MASKQPTRRNQQPGLVQRMFIQHPRSLGLGWAAHGAGAVKIGVELIGAGCAAMVHAAVPGWFTETAGRSVTRIYDHIQARKKGSADPENWPDYEI